MKTLGGRDLGAIALAGPTIGGIVVTFDGTVVPSATG